MMDLVFDQLLNPPKSLRNPPDHRHIGMTTYYGIKFKMCVQVLGYALPNLTYSNKVFLIKSDYLECVI